MATTYGVTPQGFVRPTVLDLKALMESDQLAEIASDLDVATDAILGQLNGIVARHLGIAWEALETAYNGFDPDAAEDFLLTMLSKLTGTGRRAASYTRVPCTVNLDEGTTLVPDEHFAHIEGKPDVRFTPVDEFTAPSTGNHAGVMFRAEQTGPIDAPDNQLNVIATSLVGWNSINNPTAGSRGRVADDDPTLRERREAQLTAPGSGTVDAIRADLLELDDIDAVLMYENVTDLTDTNGLPAHSFEAVIWDGDPAAADDDEIAQIIWDSKPAGVRSFGSESGMAVDRNGDEQLVSFSRATVRDVYLEFDVTPRDGYVGDSDFKLAVANACNDLFAVADDVTFYDVLLATQGLGARVDEIRMGFSSSPESDDPLDIGIREIARFSTARIAVDSSS